MAGGGLGTAIATSYVPEFVEFQKFRAIVIMWVAAELAWYARLPPPIDLRTLTVPCAIIAVIRLLPSRSAGIWFVSQALRALMAIAYAIIFK